MRSEGCGECMSLMHAVSSARGCSQGRQDPYLTFCCSLLQQDVARPASYPDDCMRPQRIAGQSPLRLSRCREVLDARAGSFRQAQPMSIHCTGGPLCRYGVGCLSNGNPAAASRSPVSPVSIMYRSVCQNIGSMCRTGDASKRAATWRSGSAVSSLPTPPASLTLRRPATDRLAEASSQSAVTDNRRFACHRQRGVKYRDTHHAMS
jgi:hypothetical protein